MQTIITLYNLSVRIETKDSVLEKLIVKFLNEYYTNVIDGGDNNDDKIVMYGSITHKYSCYTMSNQQFKQFKLYAKQRGYEFSDYKGVNEREYDVESIDYQLLPQWAVREKQQPVVDFALDGLSNIKLLPLVTGTGKTFIALYCLAQRKQRFAVMVTNYVDKWISDYRDIFGAKDDEILVVSGHKMVQSLITMGKEGTLKQKYIIFSTATIRNLITEFEEDPQFFYDKYGILPFDLFKTCGIATLLIDEAHEHFNAVFRIAITTGAKNLFLLSATMLPSNDVEERAYSALYSPSDVYHDNMLVKYLDVHMVSYNVSDYALKHLKWTVRGGPMNGAYSHNNFEKSLVRNPKLLKSYINLIVEQLQVHYFDRYLKNDKVIIFVSSIDLATRLVKYFRTIFTDYKTVRYVEKDSYEEMLTGDIIVSTILSAGTGLDIPNLRVGIQTVSTASLKQNIQSSGRLRRLPDRDVRYVCLFSRRLGKQLDYSHIRIKLYKQYASTITNSRATNELCVS